MFKFTKFDALGKALALFDLGVDQRGCAGPSGRGGSDGGRSGGKLLVRGALGAQVELALGAVVRLSTRDGRAKTTYF